MFTAGRTAAPGGRSFRLSSAALRAEGQAREPALGVAPAARSPAAGLGGEDLLHALEARELDDGLVLAVEDVVVVDDLADVERVLEQAADGVLVAVPATRGATVLAGLQFGLPIAVDAALPYKREDEAEKAEKPG